MKTRNNKYFLFLFLGVFVRELAYTACKDITPEQQRIENKVELKLSK